MILVILIPILMISLLLNCFFILKDNNSNNIKNIKDTNEIKNKC